MGFEFYRQSLFRLQLPSLSDLQIAEAADRAAQIRHLREFGMNELPNLCWDRPKLSELGQAWRLRDQDPRLFDQVHKGLPPLGTSRFRSEEWNKLAEAQQKCFPSYQLFRAYHYRGAREQYEKLIIVDCSLIKDSLLQSLQVKVLNELIKRAVKIESMPSSNVRIGVYQTYHEHHLIRWLTKEPKPKVCIASDDPGIFATCLHNEYAHLVEALRAQLYSEEDIIIHIEKLKHAARNCAFKHKLPSDTGLLPAG